MLSMHEWLSGGVSPCQGEGRGFESRLVLSKKCEKEEISDGYLFFWYVRSCRVRTVRMSTFHSGRRRRTSPGRSATSRALKEIEKESSDRWLFFLCSSPAGLERFECLRTDALIVDVNFLGAVLALRIAGSMDNDLLDKLMQDTWSQFRNFRIPFYNGEKPLHLRTSAESRQAIFFA